MKNPSFDLNVRYLDFDGRKIEIDYISSLCSDELIAYLVEGITNAKGKTLKDCLNIDNRETMMYTVLEVNSQIKTKRGKSNEQICS